MTQIIEWINRRIDRIIDNNVILNYADGPQDSTPEEQHVQVCEGQVALVTGASQGGTGTAIAVGLAAEGARVAITARGVLTGRIAFSLQLLQELRRPVRDLHGNDLVDGWQPDDLAPIIARQEARLAEQGWPDAYSFGRVHSPRP